MNALLTWTVWYSTLNGEQLWMLQVSGMVLAWEDRIPEVPTIGEWPSVKAHVWGTCNA